MPIENKICCFTGQRPQNLPWQDESDPRCVNLTERLYAEILKAIDGGYRHFISGMAVGIDQLAVKLLLKARRERELYDVFIEAALPCKDQDKLWSDEQKKEYSKLLAEANRITVISKKYTDTCMAERNRYMVNAAALVIAVTDKRPGGTMSTIAYARKQGKQVIILPP